MVGVVNKIDSNTTGLRYAEEACIGQLNEETSPPTAGASVWRPLEPNSYSDFGGQRSLVARAPINPSRQRKKGVVVDLDASGGFNTDLTQTNIQDLLQGFFFADFRRKGEELVTAVDIDAGNPDEYEVASTTGFFVGSLIQGQNFADSANNSVNVVTAIVADTSVEVADGVLAAEASPPSDAQIVVVGHEGATADIDVDVSGTLPALSSTILDFTTLGLTEGETIFIGGDAGVNQFVNAENNGFKRIRSIATNLLTFDKSDKTMVVETGTALDIRLFLGRVLKNESDPTLIKRRSYNLERTLGVPDQALPSEIQSEYLEGAVANELTLNSPTADKLTADLSFVATNSTTRTGAVGFKPGDRPALVEADAFNTTSDYSRFKMSIVTPGDEAPTPLFAFLTDFTLTINNGIIPNKALAVLGAFDVSAGDFVVNGNISAYFASVTAVDAVNNNDDITLDYSLVKQNKGISVDLPLIALGDGRPTVEKDQPVILPLVTEAASGAKIDANLDHTLMMVFYDFLPNLAA